jgi:hypothetical protein
MVIIMTMAITHKILVNVYKVKVTKGDETYMRGRIYVLRDILTPGGDVLLHAGSMFVSWYLKCLLSQF